MPQEEYIFAYTVTPLYKGQVFGAWPLHITLVPWFIVPNNDLTEAVPEIAELISKHNATSTKGEARMQFGPHSVIVMQKPDELQRLHDALIGFVTGKGWRIAAKQYTGGKFKPHITDRKHVLQSDVEVCIDNVAFVKAPIANRLTRTKTVIDVFQLGGVDA